MGFADNLNILFSVLDIFGGDVNNTARITNECVEIVDHYTFYQAILIPAVLITISFGLSKQRRQLFLDYCYGRPGMVFPMDMMTRDTSMSYAAAFAATLHLIFSVIFESKYALVSHGPDGIKSLVVLASMLIYGMVFFPVFACLAIKSTYGFAIGSLYIWMFTIMSTVQIFQCVNEYQAKTMIALGVRSIPQFLCLIYLCISLPGRFVQALKRGKNIFETVSDDYTKETLKDIKKSYVGKHVLKLLKRPPPKEEKPKDTPFKEKLKEKIVDCWHKWVYQTDDGFEYSSRFQSVMFVGVLLIYMLSFEILATGVTLLKYVLTTIDTNTKAFEAVPGNEDKILFLGVARYLAKAFRACFIVSIVITIVINAVIVLHMISSYRKHLRALHKGDHSEIPASSERSNANLLVGSIRYAGYQVGYISWGFVIQAVIIFILCFLISLMIISFQFGFKQWLFDFFIWAWPIVLSAVVINVLQMLLAKFVFLQERGKYLALENRRVLFSFTYFMFFYNIFLGLVSCLLRIIKAVVLGALLLPRLDRSTLPRSFQFLDPGFAAYVGFMHTENAHNHPVVLVLVRILLASSRSKVKKAVLNVTNGYQRGHKRGMHKQMSLEKSKAARFNWHVFYTLINNPDLRLYRKGYLQALKKAREEGVVIPVSDSLTTDPALLTKSSKRYLPDSSVYRKGYLQALKKAREEDVVIPVSDSLTTDPALLTKSSKRYLPDSSV